MTVALQQRRAKANVFLSYAREDRALAEKIARAFGQSARLFSDDLLSPGGKWQTQLRRELERSDLFVISLTPRTLTSTFALQELGAAWALSKPILAVVADEQSDVQAPVDAARLERVSLADLERPGAVDEILNRVVHP
jgi:nucleoside 2-deoxyribosyltransferase